MGSKSAKDVTAATIEHLTRYKVHVHTITADNGKEFANHEEAAEMLEADDHFDIRTVHGSIEQTITLTACFVDVLKGSDLREVSEGAMSPLHGESKLQAKEVFRL